MERCRTNEALGNVICGHNQCDESLTFMRNDIRFDALCRGESLPEMDDPVVAQCSALSSCLNTCSDTGGGQNCIDQCYNNATPEAAQRYGAIITCVRQNQCINVFNRVDQDCLYDRCGREMERRLVHRCPWVKALATTYFSASICVPNAPNFPIRIAPASSNVLSERNPILTLSIKRRLIVYNKPIALTETEIVRINSAEIRLMPAWTMGDLSAITVAVRFLTVFGHASMPIVVSNATTKELERLSNSSVIS